MGVKTLFAVALCQFLVLFAASATDVSEEEYLDFEEVMENCNATFNGGLATTVCIWRRNPSLTMGLLTTMAANGPNNPGPPTEDSEDRDAQERAPCLGLCALKKTVKKICAKFPFQFPLGVLREADDVKGVADFENSAALAELGSEDVQERAPCLGLCITYKTLWLLTKPLCKWVLPG